MSIGLQQSEIQNYLDHQRQLDWTIDFLFRLGGNEIQWNRYKDTIIDLEGYRRGLKSAENWQERIDYEKSNP